MTVVNKTHHHLPTGNVCSVELVWDVEGVTSLAVLPKRVCSRRECGLLPSLWSLCFLLSPISYHKSIGDRSSSRWRAGEATSSRRRSAGRSRRVEERKKNRAKRGSLCARRISRKTVTCHGLRVVEPVQHQALEELEEERKKRRAGRGSLCEPRKSLKTVTPDPVLSVFF